MKNGGCEMSEIQNVISNILTQELKQLFATSTTANLVGIGKQMVHEVYEIDTAMTNLYKTTDETSERYNNFFKNTCENAVKLGSSISSLVQQTTIWSKLGYSMNEAEKLAQISSLYSNISKVDNSTAIAHITTAMEAFDIEASKAMTIVDKLNTLGNKYAISANDLGAVLTASASTLASAGNDMDESLALITTMTQITQNASKSGDILNQLSTRLSDTGTQSQIHNLTSGKVDTTNLESTYDIMHEIAKIWSDINTTEQSALLEIIAGNQSTDSISALLANMSQANRVLNDSINSSGSAYKEQERLMDSLEGKTQKFESAFQSLSNTIIDSELLKWIVDFGTGTINALDSVIGKTGVAIPLATTFIGIFNKGKSQQRFCPAWG